MVSTIPLELLSLSHNNLGTQSLSVKTFGPRLLRELHMWLTYKEIGKRAKAIRNALGISQGAMAERIGLKKGSGGRIGKLERSQLWGEKGQTPEPRMLEAIARAGGLTLDHFRTEEVQNLERQERLAVLKWLNRVMKNLQDEVGLMDGP